jgi:hypothetical protein
MLTEDIPTPFIAAATVDDSSGLGNGPRAKRLTESVVRGRSLGWVESIDFDGYAVHAGFTG